MKNVNSKRVFKRNENEANSDGEFVLYWMQINRRFHYNYALEYAIGWANKLGKPLLVFEGMSCDYPWANDRIHHFILQGMAEHQDWTEKNDVNYYSYVEDEAGNYQALLRELMKKSCLIVTDEYPVFIMKERNKKIPKEVDIPYITVDSNGIIPMAMSTKAPYSAYIFRKMMQRNFVECFSNPPQENPLEDLENREKVDIPKQIKKKWPDGKECFKDIPAFISKLPIDHSVPIIEMEGTRKAGLKRMNDFLENDLAYYSEERNHPDRDRSSRLSPWLHFGKVSAYEAAFGALKRQPRDWGYDKIQPQNGKRDGFWGGHDYVDAFLDELVTWRETGFHFCHHTPNYDKFESLPDWAQETLREHEGDQREKIYSYEELAKAETSDDIWNAAQRQLVKEGVIHNYLRMLWGKNVLSWTPDVETALKYLIDLNNTYAIDGRDPNSYSGIFWILGRFDRAWGPERKVYGKVRYMTSDSTRKKIKLANYLKEFGNGVITRDLFEDTN